MEKMKVTPKRQRLLRLCLKSVPALTLLLFSHHLFGQSKQEAEIVKVSKDFFRWEIEGKMDSLDFICDENLLVVGSSGKVRGKSEFLADLKNGKPVHNQIDLEEVTSRIHANTTAILTGKGMFTITANNTKSTAHLSYMEVFVLKNKGWKLVALYASRLPE